MRFLIFFYGILRYDKMLCLIYIFFIIFKPLKGHFAFHVSQKSHFISISPFTFFSQHFSSLGFIKLLSRLRKNNLKRCSVEHHG